MPSNAFDFDMITRSSSPPRPPCRSPSRSPRYRRRFRRREKGCPCSPPSSSSPPQRAKKS